MITPRHSGVDALRVATSSIHLRLHRHPVFTPIQAGNIDQSGYVDLLMALYGFHGAFKDLSPEGPARCQRLIDDLSFLGVDRDRIDSAPLAQSPGRPSYAARWGIEYVLRGASLGGRVLARHLDRLLGVGTSHGRQFFVDKGEGAGTPWRSFIQQLDLALLTRVDRRLASDAAVATFSRFEDWMSSVIVARQANAYNCVVEDNVALSKAAWATLDNKGMSVFDSITNYEFIGAISVAPLTSEPTLTCKCLSERFHPRQSASEELT